MFDEIKTTYIFGGIFLQTGWDVVSPKKFPDGIDRPFPHMIRTVGNQDALTVFDNQSFAFMPLESHREFVRLDTACGHHLFQGGTKVVKIKEGFFLF
jgi:hypothetical protein